MTSEAAYDAAEETAKGWGGDLELTLVRDDKPEAWLKLWITSWDSEAEADEMSEALSGIGTNVHYTQEGEKVLIIRSSEPLGTLPCNKLERAMGKAKIE
jgi:hypothetical protein